MPTLDELSAGLIQGGVFDFVDLLQRSNSDNEKQIQFQEMELLLTFAIETNS